MRGTFPFPQLLIALLFAGCGRDLVAPGETVIVRTDRREYRVDEPVQVTLENRGPRAVPFYHCDYVLAFRVEKREAGRWIEYRDIAHRCLAIYMSGQFQLERGKPYRYTYALSEPGTYRLRFFVAGAAGAFVDSEAIEVE